MEKILQGARHEVDGLRNMTDTVSENQMFKLQEEIRGNSADMLVQLKNNERQSTSLDVMQVIFAGSLAFELLDRLTGEWSVVHTEWGRMWIVEPLMNKVRVRLMCVCVWGGSLPRVCAREYLPHRVPGASKVFEGPCTTVSVHGPDTTFVEKRQTQSAATRAPGIEQSAV